MDNYLHYLTSNCSIPSQNQRTSLDISLIVVQDYISWLIFTLETSNSLEICLPEENIYFHTVKKLVSTF